MITWPGKQECMPIIKHFASVVVTILDVACAVTLSARNPRNRYLNCEIYTFANLNFFVYKLGFATRREIGSRQQFQPRKNEPEIIFFERAFSLGFVIYCREFYRKEQFLVFANSLWLSMFMFVCHPEYTKCHWWNRMKSYESCSDFDGDLNIYADFSLVHS